MPALSLSLSSADNDIVDVNIPISHRSSCDAKKHTRAHTHRPLALLLLYMLWYTLFYEDTSIYKQKIM